MNRGMHILLADDESAFRFSASVALRKAGYRVSVARNGREAFSRIMEFQADGDPVHLLVTDHQMPEMTGTELVLLLRKRGNRIPVVVVTAHSDMYPLSVSPPGDISELLEKPIGPEELIACLNRVTKPALKTFS